MACAFRFSEVFCAPSAVWLAYRLATGTQMQLTNKLFNMEKRFYRTPKALLVRLHPVQNLVFICRAKQPHRLRRMWGLGLSAHLVWGCGGLFEGAIRSPFRRAAPLLCV